MNTGIYPQMNADGRRLKTDCAEGLLKYRRADQLTSNTSTVSLLALGDVFVSKVGREWTRISANKKDDPQILVDTVSFEPPLSGPMIKKRNL